MSGDTTERGRDVVAETDGVARRFDDAVHEAARAGTGDAREGRPGIE
jgi:hypothetical protein